MTLEGKIIPVKAGGEEIRLQYYVSQTLRAYPYSIAVPTRAPYESK